MGFQERFAWQHKYIPIIKNLVGPHLLEAAPVEIDRNEATDLMILSGRDKRIGCRVRRTGYADRYPWEFTIRAAYDSGTKTELQKIIEGWGDWLFYGHAEHDDLPSISRWFLIDLDAWRAQAISSKCKAGRPQKQANGDGSYFVAFDVRYFAPDPPILIASSHDLPAVAAA